MNKFLTDLKHFRPLEGYSGAEIYLCSKDNRNWFVRKIAKDAASSPRLKLQIEKQSKYADLINHIFETPEVLNIGEIDGIFYADLEFINGADGAYYLRNAELAEVKNLAFKFQEYLEFLDSNHFTSKIDNEILIQKVKNLGSKFEINIDKLIEKLNKINDLQIPETLYHGDFTMENILFNASGKIYLLDLLDAPINHYWMDCSKLFQDLSGSWFVRNSYPLPKSITNYLSQSIYNKIVKLNTNYIEYHYSLLMINFLRILPYVRNEQDKKLINQRINYLQGLI